MVIHNKYILASSSKSRYEILNKCGFVFKQVPPVCDEEKIKKEILINKISPINFVKKLSYEKSKSLSKKKHYYKSFVIGCDTIVHLNDRIFDKAKTLKEAQKKIETLSGKKHKITTGLTICKGDKKIWQCSVTSIVKIRSLTEKQIKKYLKKTGKQILQSVGCYQVESLGPQIIEYIEGDFFNVMGLPLFKFLQYVEKNK